MAIFQFESGILLPEDKIDAIVPVLQLSRTSELQVLAGAAHDAAMPSFIVHHKVLLLVRFEVDSGPNKYVVANRSIVVSHQPHNLLESTTFQRLEEEERDFVTKKVRRIALLQQMLHSQVGENVLIPREPLPGEQVYTVEQCEQRIASVRGQLLEFLDKNEVMQPLLSDEYFGIDDAAAALEAKGFHLSEKDKAAALRVPMVSYDDIYNSTFDGTSATDDVLELPPLHSRSDVDSVEDEEEGV